MKNWFIEKIVGFFSAREKRLATLFLIFLLSLMFRLIYVLSMPNTLVWYDEIKYNEKAMNLIENGHYGSIEFAPGEPIFLYGVYKIFGFSVTKARVAESVLGALSCLLLFAIGNRLFSYQIGLWAALIMAIYPLYVFSAGTLYPIVLFVFFLLLLFLLLFRLTISKSWGDAILSGILIGIETLIIPTIVFMVPVFFLWLFLLLKKSFLGKMATLLAILLSMTAILFPWSYSNSKKMGTFILVTSESGHSLWQGNNEFFDGFNRPGPDDIPLQIRNRLKGKNIDEQDKIYRQEAFRFIKEHPRRFIVLYFRKFINFWRIYPKTISRNKYTSPKNKIISLFSYGILFLLSFVGLYKTRKRFLFLSVMPLSAIAFAMGYSFFLTSTRYRLPIDVFVILFASIPLSEWFEKWLSKLSQKE